MSEIKYVQNPKAFAEAALRNQLETLRGAPKGERNDTLNRAAFGLGQLAEVGVLTYGEIERELAAAAQAVGLTPNETWLTIRSGFAGAKRKGLRLELAQDAPNLNAHRGGPDVSYEAEGALIRAVAERDRGAALRAIDWLCLGTDAGEHDPLLYGPDLAEPLPPLDYLVEGLGLVAGAGAPHIVGGAGYSGKTLAMQSLLLSLVASTLIWGEHDPGPARRVLHVDYEQGRRTTQRRYQRLAAAMEVDLAELGQDIAVLVRPNDLRLCEEHREQWLRLSDGRDLLMVDSLRAAAGGDENSSDIRAGLDMLGEVSEATGCRHVVIHHTRKPAQGEARDARYALRGSGAIYDAADSVYDLTGAKGLPSRLEQTKARSSGGPIEDAALVITDVEYDGDPRGGLRVTTTDIEVLEDLEAQQAAKGASLRENERDRRQAELAEEDAAAIRPLLEGVIPEGVTVAYLAARSGLSEGRARRAALALCADLEKRGRYGLS